MTAKIQTSSRATLIASITELPIGQIEIADDRLRPVDAAAVAAIAESIAEHGLIHPVAVRRLREGRFELVDGGHRLAALVHLGRGTAPVRCWEGPAPAIRLIEIDANLARSDLSDLDRAIHLAARKREYLREHPETAQGKAGALHRHLPNNCATAETAVAAFVALTAEKTGLNPRRVRKLVEAGEALDPFTAELLRSAPRRVSLNDLIAFAKAPGAAARQAAAVAFGEGRARTVAQALKAPARAPKDPVEAAFNILVTAWDRAPAAARKRFLLERAREVWAAQNKGAALHRVGGTAE